MVQKRIRVDTKVQCLACSMRQQVIPTEQLLVTQIPGGRIALDSISFVRDRAVMNELTHAKGTLSRKAAPSQLSPASVHFSTNDPHTRLLTSGVQFRKLPQND
jgi:hypothetical protein